MTDTNDDDAAVQADFAERITRIVCAYLSNNQVSIERIPDVVSTVATAIVGGSETASTKTRGNTEPAVPIKKSVTDDHIICLEDGKPLTMLKRYLRTHYDMSPEEYRKKWGLPHDYPMVAPAYARLRSQFAKKIGLGATATSSRAA